MSEGSVSGDRTLRETVRRFVESETRDGGPRRRVCGVEDELRHVFAVLLLYANDFPPERMHDVLWCSRRVVAECFEALREHFPDADAARRFLDEGGRLMDQSRAGARSSSPRPKVQVSEVARDALDMLDYWTSRWLEEQPAADSRESSR